MQAKFKADLIENPENPRRHVVLLGAGASRAAFPRGDRNGKVLPLMNDFVSILNLKSLLENNEINPDRNFEEIYSELYSNEKLNTLRTELENQVHSYFSNLLLPDEATHYDRLLLSLRPKDIIFTFNWDPFLMDAYRRNEKIAPLPEIFFLHGNVRIGECETDDEWGERNRFCGTCGSLRKDIPLLYPISKKNYVNHSSKYIRDAWQSSKILFKEAFTLTIFGYGAPTSDVEAKELLQNAWFDGSTRKMEHIEVIDIEKTDVLSNRWSSFTPTNHYKLHPNFQESRIWKWPRRTCESLFYPMTQGIPCEAFPLPDSNNLQDLHEFIKNIAQYEN